MAEWSWTHWTRPPLAPPCAAKGSRRLRRRCETVAWRDPLPSPKLLVLAGSKGACRQTQGFFDPARGHCEL